MFDKLKTKAGAYRNVAVVFADVQGFTEANSRLRERYGDKASELMTELIGNVTLPFKEALARHNGIKKWPGGGDSFMGVFGALGTDERNCEAAVEMAADFVSQSDNFFIEVGGDRVAINVRVGVNYGEVFVSKEPLLEGEEDPKSEGYNILGDEVNIEASIEAAAKPGQVWVSQSVREKTDHIYDFEEVGKVQAKGKPEGLQAYRFLRKREGVTHRGRAVSDTALVGRKRELGELEKSLGEEDFVYLEEEAGSGKSRLLKEIKTRLKGQVLETGFDTVQRGSLAAFKSLFRVYQPSKSQLDALGDDLPFLSGFLDLEIPGAREFTITKENRYRAISKLLETYSDETPVYLFLEDLHWADQDSLELLDAMSKSEKVKILATSRPDVKTDLSKYGRRVKFRPLGKDDRRRLVRSVVGEESYRELNKKDPDAVIRRAEGTEYQVSVEAKKAKFADLKRREKERELKDLLGDAVYGRLAKSEIENLAERSEGNPLYLEQAARGFLETGKLEISDDVADIIISRKDKLPRNQRIVLEHMMVLGSYKKDFRLTTLQDTCLFRIDENLIEQLRLGGWIEDVGEGVYQIRHHRFLETLYGGERSGEISLQDKRRIHTQVARLLENRVYGYLVSGLREAGYELAVPEIKASLFHSEKSKTREKVVGDLRQRLSAEAETTVDRKIEELKTHAEKLYKQLASPIAEEIAHHWLRADNTRQGIRFLDLARAEQIDPYEKIRLLDRTIQILEQTKDSLESTGTDEVPDRDDELLKINFQLARRLHQKSMVQGTDIGFLGSASETSSFANEALSETSLGIRDLNFSLRINQANIERNRGDYDRSLQELEEAKTIVGEPKSDKDLQQLVTYHINCGLAYHRKGELGDASHFDTALEHYGFAEEIAKRTAYKGAEVYVLSAKASAYQQKGRQRKEDYLTAIQLFNQYLDTVRGNVSEEAKTLCNLGDCYLEYGDRERALECNQEALMLAERSRSLIRQAYVLMSRGYIYGEQGDLDQARENLQTARDLANRLGRAKLREEVEGYIKKYLK